MSNAKDISLAMSSYGSAIRFIAKNHLKRYFLFPILINIILYYFGFELIGNLTDQFIAWFTNLLAVDTWDFWGSGVLADSINWLIWLIGKIFTFLILIFFGGYVVLILMSPVLAFVSEKTEQKLNGTEYPFSLKLLLSDIVRGVGISIRNFAIEMGFTVILFLVSFIPLAGFITAPLLFFISSYFYGFSFLDYNLERKRFSMSQSISFMKKNKGLVIGNGLIFTLLLLIPIIGVTLASFAAIVSTVAATLSLQKKNITEPPISLFKS